MLYKRYVDVVALIDKEAKITPLFIIWDNGVKYSIDKIIDIRNATSQVGGCGVLYKCQINNQTRNIFLERNRWFIESYRP